jgi:2-keto-4-pentenoate hydratase/2-oxohepta-3-ene-1,7-dioic acid hydratase (catechol pathway)
VNHVALVRAARGAPMLESFYEEPLVYQGAGDANLGPCDDIPLADTAWGADFEAEVAVMLGPLPIGATADQARAAVRLVMLVNDVSLRGLVPGELAKGFGFFQSKPQTAYTPVAVTPDELGGAWDGDRLHLAMRVDWNGQRFGRAEAGEGMVFGFGDLARHIVRTRPCAPGTILGSGTVSNEDAARGASCIAEIRAREAIAGGAAKTRFLQPGDTIAIEMLDAAGRSVFGAIRQRVVAA